MQHRLQRWTELNLPQHRRNRLHRLLAISTCTMSAQDSPNDAKACKSQAG